MTRLAILSAPCDQCPWKAGLRLAAGRLRDLREQCLKQDSPFVCHKTIIAADKLDKRNPSPVFDDGVAVCAGWLELDDPITVVQVATRLDLVEYIDPPEGVPE